MPIRELRAETADPDGRRPPRKGSERCRQQLTAKKLGAQTKAGRQARSKPAAVRRRRRQAPADGARALRRAPPERGPRPAPDGGLRGARGLPRARRVAQPPARGDLQGPRRDRRHGRRRRVRRRAHHRRAAPRQPGAATAAARVETVVGAVELLTPQTVQALAARVRTFDFFERASVWDPRPSASACTRSPPSTPPTASPPRSATSTATA